MGDRTLAYIILAHIWAATVVPLLPGPRWLWAGLAAGISLGCLFLAVTIERDLRRNQAAADNLRRNIAAARYREAADGS